MDMYYLGYWYKHIPHSALFVFTTYMFQLNDFALYLQYYFTYLNCSGDMDSSDAVDIN